MSMRARLLGATLLTSLAVAGGAAAQGTAPEAPVARGNTTPAVSQVRPGATDSAVSGELGAPNSPGANNQVPPSASPTGGEEVVVTGSRIRRTDLTTAQPISVIGGQYIQDKGFINVADAINQLPGVQGSITPVGDQASYGTGRNYINLFNLGTGRTLTLVNGRRFITDNAAANVGGLAAGSQVNLNAIPTAFIDRIENVQAGGSAVYGSDAIAGVVNIITKDRYKGLELDAQYGRSDRDDDPQYRARIAAGFDFLGGRGNLAMSFEYAQTASLLSTQRDRTAADYTFATNPFNRTTTDGIPSTTLIANRRVPEVTPGGVLFRTNSSALANLVQVRDPTTGALTPVQFATGGTLIPYNTGTFYSSSVASGGDGLDLATVTALQTPNKRYVLGGLGTFEITSHIRAHAEFNAVRVDGTEPANQPIYNSAIFSGTACPSTGGCPTSGSAASGNFQFPVTNPFLPAATVAQLQAAGVNQFFLSRSSEDLVGGRNPVVSQDNLYRGVIGFDGDFTLLGRKFNWNTFYNYGQTDGSFTNVQIDQQKLVYALNAVRDGSGNIVCATPAAALGGANAPRFAGCSPINLFGNGSASPSAIAYVTQAYTSRFYNKEQNAQANLSGTLIDLPGGPLQVNIGWEYRREFGKFSPDAASAAGIGRSVAIVGSSGAFHTNEFYSEAVLPIFGHGFSFPLMRRFEIDFSDREVENSLSGWDRAYSYQGRWYPFDDLLIRATRSRSFRAPAVTQLFAPVSSAFSTATDPCDRRSINAGANPTVRAANCLKAFQALGLSANDLANFTSLVQDRTSPILTGGNSSLKNEIGNQYSYGFVYQPHFVRNFALSMDLVNINLSGAISNFSLTNILSTCYDQPNQPGDVCSRFTRLSNGQIADNAQTGFVNAGFIHFQAMDVAISYEIEPHYLQGFEFIPGKFGVNITAENYQRYDSSVSGTGLDIVRSAGTFGVPRWTGIANISYALGGFRGIVTERYTSSVRYNNSFTIENQSILAVSDYKLTDLAFSYAFRNFTARFGVYNVFDTRPPFPSTSAAYDLVGRYFFGGLNARF